MKKQSFNLKIKNFDLLNPEKKKTYNEKLFSEVAPKYNFLTKVLSFGRDKSWKTLLIKKLPDLNKPDCLDLASGTGDITFALSKKYPEGKITGIDLNQDMIILAKKIMSNKKIKNITFKLMDMCNTGLKSNCFDIVTGSYALRNAPDLIVSLKEIKRIMKNGGTAGFLDFSKSPNRFIQRINLFFLKLWGNIWGIILHGNPEVYGYIAESLNKFPDRNNLKTIIEKTGFKNISTKQLFFGFLELIIFKK